MPNTVLQRSAAARWALAIPFGSLGLVFLAVAPASGLLSAPIGVFLVSLAWWLVTGAEDPPSPGVKWTMVISGGLTALMLVGAIVFAIANRS